MTENDDAEVRERNTNLNSSTGVKAESDVCCTSANAVKVIESVDSEEILFVPDQYLEYYNSPKTDRRISPWPGFCLAHVRIRPQYIASLRQEHAKPKWSSTRSADLRSLPLLMKS